MIWQNSTTLDKGEMIGFMKRKMSILSLIILALTYFTIGAYGSANAPLLKLDRSSYIGLGVRPVVTLQDSSLNTNSRKREDVTVSVCSDTDTSGISLKLIETAPDTGEFTSEFSLVNTKSDNAAKVLKVKNNDNITVTYADAAISCSSRWNAAPGAVKFSKKEYIGLNSNAIVTITDKDLNRRSGCVDTAKVRVYSDTDPKGIWLTAYEKGSNTGIFTAGFGFDINRSSSGNAVIKVSPTDKIYASYTDEMDETGAIDVDVTETADFKFAEASIKTSATKDEGAGCLLTITIDEPDKNNPKIKDRLLAKASSGNGAQEITLRLEETGTNTGSFKCKLLLNDEATTANSLRVKSSDIICIKYLDKTVPQGGAAEVVKEVKWTYIGTLLKTDKTEYSGYSRSVKITLIDYRLNTDPEKAEKMDVKITTSDSKGIKLELKESSADSGEFTGTLYFGKTSKASKGILKVVNNETITVTFTNPKDKDDIVECYATWSFHDGRLDLDKQQYMGDNIPVKVTLSDMDLNGNPNMKESIKVTARLQGGGNSINVVLEEISKDSDKFKGTFYINGTGSNKPPLKLNPGDKFEVVYTDEKTKSGKSEERIASAVYGGMSKAQLTLDSKKYTGYGEFMVIIMKDPDQNKDPAASDQVPVQVKTKSGLTNATYKLAETGTNNGEFILVLTFTEEPGTPTTLRVAPNDEITVNFLPKGVSTSATFTK